MMPQPETTSSIKKILAGALAGASETFVSVCEASSYDSR